MVGSGSATAEPIYIHIHLILTNALVIDKIHAIRAARTPKLITSPTGWASNTLSTHIILPLLTLHTLPIYQKSILHTPTIRIRSIDVVIAQRIGLATVTASLVASAPRRAIIANTLEIVEVVEGWVDLRKALADAIDEVVRGSAAAEDSVGVVGVQADAQAIAAHYSAEHAWAGGVVAGVCDYYAVGSWIALEAARTGATVAAYRTFRALPIIQKIRIDIIIINTPTGTPSPTVLGEHPISLTLTLIIDQLSGVYTFRAAVMPVGHLRNDSVGAGVTLETACIIARAVIGAFVAGVCEVVVDVAG